MKIGRRNRGVKEPRSAADRTNHRANPVRPRHAINYANLRIPQIVDPPSVHFVMISFRFLAHRPSNFGANPPKYPLPPRDWARLAELE